MPDAPPPAHRIRLRDFWTVTTAGGRTRHARRFGRPRTPDPTATVWLVCDHVPAAGDVFVNGVAVGPAFGGPFAADVTHLLTPRNEIAFEVASADPLGEVAVEIRPGREPNGA